MCRWRPQCSVPPGSDLRGLAADQVAALDAHISLGRHAGGVARHAGDKGGGLIKRVVGGDGGALQKALRLVLVGFVAGVASAQR